MGVGMGVGMGMGMGRGLPMKRYIRPMLALTILTVACVIIRNAMARASGLADLGSAS